MFGSTVVDNDGKILHSTNHGHGDALHVSDFDNDGEQEIFSVHEEEVGYKEYGAELRKAKDGAIITAQAANGDVGRGLMGNFDDDTDGSEFFTSIDCNLYDMMGNKIGEIPYTQKEDGSLAAGINPSFLAWWDGDLAREVLRGNKLYEYVKL